MPGRHAQSSLTDQHDGRSRQHARSARPAARMSAMVADTRPARLLAVFTAILLLAAFVAPAGASASDGADRVDVLIGFDRAPGDSEHDLVRGHGGEVSHSYDIVPAVAASIPQRAVDNLQRSPRVTYIEPDGQVFAHDLADVLDHETVSETVYANTWGVAHIGGADAHAQGATGSGVRVAVLDTGIVTEHPDLDYDEACSTSAYDSVEDGNGHGTHVAGTVAALGNEVIGVAPEVTLCVHKVLSDDGSGSYSDIVAAMDDIRHYNEKNADDPIRVANHSYGGGHAQTMQDAITALDGDGVLNVAAAGNSGHPSGRGDNCSYPALYDAAMAVAATDQDDERARWSSTCDELEISAPGVGINSTYLDDGYASLSGTSMASPHVAGTAALLFAAGLDDHEEVRGLLAETATALGSQRQYGAGLVQAATAVSEVDEGGSDDDGSDDDGGSDDGDEGDDGDDGGTDTAVEVADITYSVGGRHHLRVTAALVDDDGAPIEGADVTLTIEESSEEDGPSQTATGTTGSDGTVTVQFNHALREGECYDTTVDAITGDGLDWDGTYPETNNCS